MPETYDILGQGFSGVGPGLAVTGTCIIFLGIVIGLITPAENVWLVKLGGTFLAVVGISLIIASAHAFTDDCNNYCKKKKQIECEGNCGNEILKIGVYVTGLIIGGLIFGMIWWTNFEDTNIAGINGKIFCSLVGIIGVTFLLIYSINVGGVMCNCSKTCSEDVKYGFLTFTIIGTIAIGLLMAFTTIENTTPGKFVIGFGILSIILPTLFYMIGCKYGTTKILKANECVNLEECSCLI